MGMAQQKHFFDITEISQRVKVEKLYFAFQQLWSDEDSLVGIFSSEQPLAYEVGPITAGELGRHMGGPLGKRKISYAKPVFYTDYYLLSVMNGISPVPA